MEALTDETSGKIIGIMVGPEEDSSVIYIPSGFNIDRIFASIVWDKNRAQIPISEIRISLRTWLKLIEEVYKGLIQANQPELARQILSRGG